MKALIVEDEKAAARNLKALLAQVAPQIEPLAVADSIAESTEWLASHPMPDVIFMDIHLADGSAFEIFEHTRITCPVIFTTAYDEYALRAFKVNSVDYLLKPIGEEDLRRAIAKLSALRGPEPQNDEKNLASLIRALQRQAGYKTHFLIPSKGSKLIPLAVESIQYFCVNEGVTRAVVSEKEHYVMSRTLDELAECLNPDHFLKVNRQYLISKNAVKDIDLWFNGRLAVNLKITPGEKIIVSKARVGEFKTWFSGTSGE